MAYLQYGNRAVDLASKEETKNLLRTWKPPSQVRAREKPTAVTNYFAIINLSLDI